MERFRTAVEPEAVLAILSSWDSIIIKDGEILRNFTARIILQEIYCYEEDKHGNIDFFAHCTVADAEHWAYVNHLSNEGRTAAITRTYLTENLKTLRQCLYVEDHEKLAFLDVVRTGSNIREPVPKVWMRASSRRSQSGATS